MDFEELLQAFGIESGDLGSGILVGVVGWLFVRYVLTGFFTVDQSERAVKVRLGRAERLGTMTSTAVGRVSEGLVREDQDRYVYPRLRVIPPGGPYFRWPWEQVVKISVATQTLNMAYDPESPTANRNNTTLEAVTKDQLNVGLSGQLRYRVSENNLYAFLFGVKNPIAHMMGYFISILRQHIASFEAPAARAGAAAAATPEVAAGEGALTTALAHPEATAVTGVSINDLRKNMRDLNELMDRECKGSEARYGVVLDASLITEIEPPREVESALAAINTAHNEVSSDVSLAQASADQKIVQSRRAVEIETLNAQAEVEPLTAMAQQLTLLKASGGPNALKAYLRNVKLGLYKKAHTVILGEDR